MQIQNFVAYHKRTVGINARMNEAELREFCAQHSTQPAAMDQPYIVYHSITSAKDVFILWSTPHLLAKQRNFQPNFCIEGTYKITSLNWPVLVRFLK